MNDLPDTAQLLAAVVRFLREDAVPALGRHGAQSLAYQARVAANMLEVVARQQQLAPAAASAELARLQTLLGAAGNPDLAALNAALAERIADGRQAPDDPALAAHLWATTLDKLAVDQPGYDTFLRHASQPPEP